LQERAEQDRRARRTARNWSLGLGVLAVLMLVLAGYALHLWNDAQEKTRIAEAAEQKAKVATEQAETRLLTANINLARAHEEKALALLKLAFNTEHTGDYQRALLHALQAQRQPIQGNPGLQPKGMDRLTAPQIVQAFSGQWRSPTSRLGSKPQDIAWSPDGSLMATAQADGSIRLWDPTTGKLLRTLTGHESYVTAVAFSADGKLLASASDDRTVRLWDMRGPRLLLNGPAPAPRAALIFEAPQRLWRLRLDGLDIKPETWTRLWPRDGYYVDQEFEIDVRPAAATADPDSKPIPQTFNIRPLLDPPPAGQDKLDQFLDWLKKQEPRLQP